MDIFIYDTIQTYHKRNPVRNDPFMELEIYKTFITKNKAFWFFTHFNYPEHTLNINKPYVHFHDGVENLNQMKITDQPEQILKHEWKYNYKKKRLEAKIPRILFWRKPKFVKKVTYYGVTLENRVSPLGTWFYDATMERINIILDYFPEIKVTFKEGYEMPTMEERLKKLDRIADKAIKDNKVIFDRLGQI